MKTNNLSLTFRFDEETRERINRLQDQFDLTTGTQTIIRTLEQYERVVQKNIDQAAYIDQLEAERDLLQSFYDAYTAYQEVAYKIFKGKDIISSAADPEAGKKKKSKSSLSESRLIDMF